MQRVALDCLSYHATATDNDTTWLARESIPLAGDFNLYSYKFNDTLYQDSKTLKIVLRMFLDFDLINKFSIPYKVNYILKVTPLISAVKRSIGSTTSCTITEKAPTRAFSWLKAPTSAFTFKTLLRQ